MNQPKTKKSNAMKIQKENVLMNTGYMRPAKNVESSYMTPMFMQQRNNNQDVFDPLIQYAPLKKKSKKKNGKTEREPLQFYLDLEDENGEEMKVSYKSISFLNKPASYKPKMKQMFYKHPNNVQRGVGANIKIFNKAEQRQLPNSYLNKKKKK
mgnify:CR=1 FL=1